MSGEREPNRPPVLVRFAIGALAKSYEDFRSWTGQVQEDISRLPDEIKKIPVNLASLPVQAVTNAVSSALRLQQNFNSLVIKGDETLDLIFQKPEEKPSWATFDEDEDDEIPPPALADAEQVATVAPITRPRPSSAAKPGEQPKPEQTRQRATPTSRANAKPASAKPATSKPTATKPTSAKPKTEKPASSKPPARSKPAASKTTAKKPPAPKSSTARTSEPKLSEPKSQAPTTAPASRGNRPELVEYLEYETLSLAQLRARARNLSVPELRELLSFERDNDNRPPFITLLENRITTSEA
ncbi:conserved hypothetical protein [Segniliparus rotundus DSM 44985]|uniref:Uncharacterized protein n=1 Tax=Segniliparus rotundus (strain ATCC BAA-972 / CDC 1076 / CIP 108378 / DSM 44985 / JCM 13578) TaxID=640132 RepID=D6ZF38_SEGRD|nr:conserved hypothetical protein [Segniliparus rotundus DSM 44985]